MNEITCRKCGYIMEEIYEGDYVCPRGHVTPGPKITKCPECDWTTKGIVKICEKCGAELIST